MGHRRADAGSPPFTSSVFTAKRKLTHLLAQFTDRNASLLLQALNGVRILSSVFCGLLHVAFDLLHIGLEIDRAGHKADKHHCR